MPPSPTGSFSLAPVCSIIVSTTLAPTTLALQVAEHVEASFNTDEYVQSHLNKTINEVVVLYTPTAEIKRPTVEQKYTSMPGMKKTFLFMPVREGVVLQKKFACWCAPAL